MVELTQDNREYRIRELLGFAAGYEISKADAAQDCSVLAKHATAAAIRFADETRLTAEQAKDAEIEQARAEAFEEAARVAYRVCAETRHVTLGRKTEDAIRNLTKGPTDADG